MTNVIIKESEDQPNLSIETPRLHIRTSRYEDADAMTAMLQVPGVADRLALFKLPYEPIESEIWCMNAETGLASENNWLMAILHRENEKQIGCIGLHRDAAVGGDWLPTRSAASYTNTAEIGYWIGKDHWGHGYASEAVGAMLYFGFEKRDLTMIHASASPENEQSDHILLRHQFRQCGTFMREIADGRTRPSVRYELTAPEWRANHG